MPSLDGSRAAVACSTAIAWYRADHPTSAEKFERKIRESINRAAAAAGYPGELVSDQDILNPKDEEGDELLLDNVDAWPNGLKLAVECI